jgi:hypothetical protein
MTKGELEALIDGGSIEACVAALEGMPESDRSKLGSAAVARLRSLGKGIPRGMTRFIDANLDPQVLALGAIGPFRAESYRVARAAVLATASISQWKGVRHHGLPSNELTIRILRDRRPTWIDELVEFVCEGEDDFNPRWALIRGLVRDGLCSPPRSGRYIDRMLNTLPHEAWISKGGLKDTLLADPGLLEHEIWRIFETEPAPRAVQLMKAGTLGVRPETTWEVALTELAKEGHISRERLLASTLDGLSRDLHDLRARWFVVLHERLEPTPEEMVSRRGRYLDFLGSRNPSTIAFALKVIKELMTASPLDPEILIDRLAPALHARTKGTVNQALALLDQLIRRSSDSALKARAVAASAEALVHESADIQEATLKLIEEHGDPHDRPLRDLLAARIDALAASLRGRLESWLGAREEPRVEPVAEELTDLKRRATELDPRLSALAGVPEAMACARGERSDLPALSFDGTEIPRLDPERRLEPIDDLDTLIELCSRLIETPEPAEDLDRCVEAISRLCDLRPADFEKRTAPLAARVEKRLHAPELITVHAVSSFGSIVWSWLSKQGRDALNQPQHSADFMSGWVRSVARRVGRAEAAPLLAAPTHAGGWIDPRALVERFRRRCRLPIADEPDDLVLAMLRLAPDHRATALADAKDLRGEQGSAIRYALGSNDETIGPTAPLWVAAARARSPWADDPAVEARHPGLGPDAGRAAEYCIDGMKQMRGWSGRHQLQIGRKPDVPEGAKARSDLPTVAYHSVQWVFGGQWPSPASLWPIALDSFCAAAAQQMIESSESSSDWQGNRGFLLPLLDPDVPLRPMARFLLSVCLNAKLPEVAGLATDVLIAAIDHRRLDAETLAESLCAAWRLRVETWTYIPVGAEAPATPPSVGLMKPARWAKALGEVSGSSLLHARLIAQAVEHVLADEATASRTIASLIPLLELLRETSVTTGRTVSTEARAYLGKIETGGKTGRVVRDLLALREIPNPTMWRKLAIQALARRITRAERWMKWEQFSSQDRAL